MGKKIRNSSFLWWLEARIEWEGAEDDMYSESIFYNSDLCICQNTQFVVFCYSNTRKLIEWWRYSLLIVHVCVLIAEERHLE